MYINKLTLQSPLYPSLLRDIQSPPKQLFYMGASLEDMLLRPRVAIVGNRAFSPYGEQVTRRMASELAEQGIVIISGLALGIDAIAHRAALEANGTCIAVLPCPLDKIIPMTNRRLAQRIVEQGGTLVSEYAPDTHPVKQYFIARNRIVSGLSDIVLITEAGKKSGSLHTARFARDQGRDILVVPGDIHREGSAGTNNLVKQGYAGLATNSVDVLAQLGISRHEDITRQVRGRNAYEQTVLDLMAQGIVGGSILLEASGLTASDFNQVLTMLEISDKIRPLGANNWALK